ncbi:MAG: hypothetical protein HN368_24135 [Spirochaetales bacterium]|jgi:hypothetical protein|nr:hypothetical protein [Spirochaetales bacterium]
MINRIDLTEAQARQAIADNEFGEDVRGSSEHVAVVLTQGWCPQWVMMNGWLKSMQKKNESESLDLDVYVLVYDRVPYSSEFMRFKETTFSNYEIPYVRYYYKGNLIDESNYISKNGFLRIMEKAGL